VKQNAVNVMNQISKQILFVGADAETASDLQERIARTNLSWGTDFVQGGDEALALLDQKHFDAVVTDDHLVDFNGFRLLDSIQERYPSARRLIVCELSHPKAGLNGVGSAHQCVPKPWDADTLRATLERNFALSVWLSNPTVRTLVQRMKVMPSPPDLYFEIVRALRSPEVDLERISTRAAQDVAMTAKLLQLVNSAVLGLRYKVTNVKDAISFLGLETTRSLVLLAHTFSYCSRTEASGFSIERLWRHSLATASLTRRIAREQKGSPDFVDECFLAGLLHDIGELLLAVNLPREYSEVIAKSRRAPASGGGKPSWQIELEMFGATHAEIGAELMAIWNLPLTVVEALALHHQPSKVLSQGFSPLAAVHVADALECELSPTGGVPEGNVVDLEYLHDIGLADRLEAWREACRQEIYRGVDNTL
jgi:HD-like signal output (HDOD) protein